MNEFLRLKRVTYKPTHGCRGRAENISNSTITLSRRKITWTHTECMPVLERPNIIISYVPDDLHSYEKDMLEIQSILLILKDIGNLRGSICDAIEGEIKAVIDGETKRYSLYGDDDYLRAVYKVISIMNKYGPKRPVVGKKTNEEN